MKHSLLGSNVYKTRPQTRVVRQQPTAVRQQPVRQPVAKQTVKQTSTQPSATPKVVPKAVVPEYKPSECVIKAYECFKEFYGSRVEMVNVKDIIDGEIVQTDPENIFICDKN